MKRLGYADSDRHGCRALAACVVALVLCAARPAAAQVAVQMAVPDADEQQQPQKNTGFSIKKEDQKVIEQIEDFERYRDKKAWDRAFKSLSAVEDAKDNGGLAPTKDGFWVPTRQRLMQTLIALPPEGKEAYRLFNDAKAKQKWDQILAHEAAGDADTLTLLKKLVEQFPITAVGDKAADHLGDALMEAGDYTGAARAYDAILQARPDTDLPPLRIQIKRATALARAGRMEAFRELASQIREKHAGESVKVAGKDVPVEEFLSTLSAAPATTRPAATGPSTASSETPEPSTPISLSSATTRPAWRSVFLDHALRDKINAQLSTNGWMAQQMGGVVNVSPAAATDGKRVFLNWYGTIWALDIQTGKILWWSGHFAQLGDKINEMAQWQIEQRRFSITVAGDNVLTVALRLDRLNQQEPYRLNCIEPATGKKKWSSESGPLSNWAFIGEPTVVDGTIYITAHPRNSQDMHALAVNLADGKLAWEVALGQPQVANNWRGMPIYPLPVLKLVGGTLYVMTNNGAVIALDAASRQVLWSFSYETVFKGGNENGVVFWNGMPMAQTPAQPAGAALLHDGVLYFKDSDGSAIYALDLSGPKLLFRRPVDEDQLLAHVDDAGFCLVGPTFSLIDAKTRTLTWAPALPVTADAMKPVRAGDDYLVFTGRGIYQINPAKQTIEIFRGADLESVGGSLLRAGDKLIAVSNLSVTAYEVGRPTTASR
jgi:outer membrane protein assembly factor BamB